MSVAPDVRPPTDVSRWGSFDVRFGSKADILCCSAGVCFTPESGHLGAAHSLCRGRKIGLIAALGGIDQNQILLSAPM